MRRLLIFCFFLGMASFVSAQDNIGETFDEIVTASQTNQWKGKKTQESISLKWRWLNFSDTLKTRELEIRFNTNLNPEEIVYFLRNKEVLKQWNLNVKEIEILEEKNDSWVDHTTYDIPFPFAKQDLLTKNWIEHQDETLLVHTASTPNLLPVAKGVKRQEYYYSKWSISEDDKGGTEVVFNALSFSDNKVPRWIKDPVVHDRLLDSFQLLKELCESRYASGSFSEDPLF